MDFFLRPKPLKRLKKKMVEQFFNYYRIIEGGRNIVIRWMDEFGLNKKKALRNKRVLIFSL